MAVGRRYFVGRRACELSGNVICHPNDYGIKEFRAAWFTLNSNLGGVTDRINDLWECIVWGVCNPGWGEHLSVCEYLRGRDIQNQNDFPEKSLNGYRREFGDSGVSDLCDFLQKELQFKKCEKILTSSLFCLLFCTGLQTLFLKPAPTEAVGGKQHLCSQVKNLIHLNFKWIMFGFVRLLRQRFPQGHTSANLEPTQDTTGRLITWLAWFRGSLGDQVPKKFVPWIPF